MTGKNEVVLREVYRGTPAQAWELATKAAKDAESYRHPHIYPPQRTCNKWMRSAQNECAFWASIAQEMEVTGKDYAVRVIRAA